MPSSLSASSLHILRASRILGISPNFILSLFSLSFLIGSLITIYYGYLLINIYGDNPERMPLDRWIPYTLWSLSVYRGELDSKSILPGTVIGVLVMVLLAIVDRLTGKSFSPIPFIIGLTLTTDFGILFILGSFLRWFVSKFGGGAEKQLMIVASSLLAGAGIAITIYTVFNAIGLI
jgi:OPT oligopeptide transporter protein.